MRLLEFREDDHIGDDRVAETLTYVESFIVRRLIAGVTTGNLTRIFQRLAVQLAPEDDAPEAVRTALSPARLSWPSDEQLRDAVRNRAFYWQGRTALEQLAEDEGQHRQFVHTLGNLTLSGYNSELGNSSFATKRRQLGQSGLLMNQEIAARERWGKAEILARADRRSTPIGCSPSKAGSPRVSAGLIPTTTEMCTTSCGRKGSP
ncbi:HNH endonuclease family protein [Nonomuraea soli]|uniref:GmrSD restriction endonucleases C-terminal domain-containing protein n=1 Tax=Nonomuraea soli TaxID=1032476 RepID=A0A7W0CHT1_9ACTN|nr:HNH endonuclease family protein [Nonomuraea soli]MBA2891420.1 hypothetical protein [Nonomuraea soli]